MHAYPTGSRPQTITTNYITSRNMQGTNRPRQQIIHQPQLYQQMVMPPYHQYSATPRPSSTPWNHQNPPVSFTQLTPVFPLYQYPVQQHSRSINAPNLTNSPQSSINMQSNMMNSSNVQVPNNNGTLNSTNIHQSQLPRKRREHAIAIVDPQSGKDVLDDVLGDTLPNIVSFFLTMFTL